LNQAKPRGFYTRILHQCEVGLFLAILALATYLAGSVYTLHFPRVSSVPYLVGVFAISAAAVWHLGIACFQFRGQSFGRLARFGPATLVLVLIVLRVAWIEIAG
jgi:hypothetical protein